MEIWIINDGKACRIMQINIPFPLVHPMKCIVRMVNREHLSEMAKRQAISVKNSVRKAGLSDVKNPMGLAATVLYASRNRGNSQN
jgi:transcription initiation factor TFIIB